MKQCKSCGFYNTDEQERCLKCSAVIEHTPDEITFRKLPKRRKHIKIAPFAWVNKFSYAIKQYFTFELPRDVEWRYPWVAGWLGIIPGLGQIYNHQYRKAIWFFLGWVVLLIAFILTITQWLNLAVNALLVIYMLWSFNDGVVTATRINGQEWRLRQTLALLSYLLFMLGVLLMLAQFFFTPLFILVYVSQDTLAPGLRKGDRLFIDCITYWFRSPKRGEIVYYDPPRYTIEIPGEIRSTTYVINERRSFGRVVGLPGDRYERRGGKYYLNGKPVLPSLEPLTSSALWQDFEFESVPEGKILVVIGHASMEEAFIGLLGGKSPKFTEGIVKGWKEACLVTKKEIFGRGVCIYYPPPRRQWLLPQNVTNFLIPPE